MDTRGSTSVENDIIVTNSDLDGSEEEGLNIGESILEALNNSYNQEAQTLFEKGYTHAKIVAFVIVFLCYTK